MNGGTCIDGVDNFTCSCPSNLTGVLCECLIIGSNEFDCAYVSPTIITITSSTRMGYIPTKISTTTLSNLSTEIEKLTTEFMIETTEVPNLITFSTETESVAPTLAVTEKSTSPPSIITELSTEFTYEQSTTQHSTTSIVNETSSEGITTLTPTAETTSEISSTTLETTFKTTTPEEKSSQITSKTITTPPSKITSVATEIPSTNEPFYSTEYSQTESSETETAIFETSKYPQPTTEESRSTVSIETTAAPNVTIVPRTTIISSEETTPFVYTEETILTSSVTPFLTMEPRSEGMPTSFSTIGTTISSDYNVTTPHTVIPDCTKIGNECRNGGTCTFDSMGYRVCMYLFIYKG